MKTNLHLLLAVSLFGMMSCVTQTRVVSSPPPPRVVTVEAMDYDISYNLDLEAVATLFGSVNSLEEFERRLNSYDNQISNLDMNNDGYIDYLRVVEMADRQANVIVIQAVLGTNVYQDVATIVVEKKNKRTNYVQIIGSPYLYGVNYIIEPVYYWRPPIFNVFWGSRYVVWNSPYYWGYYPSYYNSYYRPVAVNVYVRNVHVHINHQHTYNYRTQVRYQQGVTMSRSISRNDYGTNHPERTFSSRNSNVSNSYELRSSRTSSSTSSSATRGNTTTSSGTNNSTQRSGSNSSTVRESTNSSSTRTGQGQAQTNSSTRNTVNTTTGSSRSNTSGTSGSTSNVSTSNRSRETTIINNSNTNSTRNSNSGTKVDTNRNNSSSSGTSSRSSGTTTNVNSSSRSNNNNTSGSSSRTSSGSSNSSNNSSRNSSSSSSSRSR